MPPRAPPVKWVETLSLPYRPNHSIDHLPPGHKSNPLRGADQSSTAPPGRRPPRSGRSPSHPKSLTLFSGPLRFDPTSHFHPPRAGPPPRCLPGGAEFFSTPLEPTLPALNRALFHLKCGYQTGPFSAGDRGTCPFSLLPPLRNARRGVPPLLPPAFLPVSAEGRTRGNEKGRGGRRPAPRGKRGSLSNKFTNAQRSHIALETPLPTAAGATGFSTKPCLRSPGNSANAPSNQHLYLSRRRAHTPIKQNIIRLKPSTPLFWARPRKATAPPHHVTPVSRPFPTRSLNLTVPSLEFLAGKPFVSAEIQTCLQHTPRASAGGAPVFPREDRGKEPCGPPDTDSPLGPAPPPTPWHTP